MRHLALLLSLPLAAFAAGPIDIGVKGGVALNDLRDTVDAVQGNPLSFFSGNRRIAVGPTFELNLPGEFSIEVDVLWRRYQAGADSPATRNLLPFVTRATGNSFEFPVLLKYKFSEGLVRPYLVGGGAFRRLTGLSQVTQFVTGPPSGYDFEEADKNTTGFVVGGGVQLSALGIIKFSPEIRFTRYGVNSFSQGLAGLRQINRNQAEVLLGITF